MGRVQIWKSTKEEASVKIKRNHLGESAWVIFGQIISVSGSVLLITLLTNYLKPEEYGRLVLVLTFAILISQVLIGGLVVSFGRYYSIALEAKEITAYIKSIERIIIKAAGLIMVFAAGVGAALHLLKYSEWLLSIGLTAVFSVVSGCNAILSGVQNAARQRKIVAGHLGVEATLKLILTYVICEYSNATIEKILMVYIVAATFTTLSQYHYLENIKLKQSDIKSKKDWSSEIWKYSTPFFIWGPFTWMQLISDRWALKIFSSEEQVGQYAVVYQIGYTPIILVTGMVVNIIGPMLFQRSGSGKDEERNKEVEKISWRLTILSLIFTLFVFFVAFGIHDLIFRQLTHPDYQGTSYLLPWLIMAGGIYAAGQMLSLKIMSDMQVSSLLGVKIVTALLGVVLNILGARMYGVDGVVASMVLFSISFLLWMIMLSNKKIGDNN